MHAKKQSHSCKHMRRFVPKVQVIRGHWSPHFFHCSHSYNLFFFSFASGQLHQFLLHSSSAVNGTSANTLICFCLHLNAILPFKNVYIYAIRFIKSTFLSFSNSKLAVFDGKKAIRGGIPFVFRKYSKLATSST